MTARNAEVTFGTNIDGTSLSSAVVPSFGSIPVTADHSALGPSGTIFSGTRIVCADAKLMITTGRDTRISTHGRVDFGRSLDRLARSSPIWYPLSPAAAQARVYTINNASVWLLDHLHAIADEIGPKEIARIRRNMVLDMPISSARHFFRTFFLHRRR
jgi:hypothetical protein